MMSTEGTCEDEAAWLDAPEVLEPSAADCLLPGGLNRCVDELSSGRCAALESKASERPLVSEDCGETS